MIDELYKKLQVPVDFELVNNLGHEVFYEGRLEEMEKFFFSILPIVNLSYYKYIVPYDDGGYAREDLLQDAILEIYRDITLRWDKFIYVENYYSYFKTICKNVMLNLVQAHHGYYMNVEFNPDLRNGLTETLSFESAEAKIQRDFLKTAIIDMTRRLCKNRKGYAKVLDFIVTWKYVDKRDDVSAIKSKLKTSWWLKRTDINMLIDHVTYLYRFSYNYYLAIERGESSMVRRLDQIISRFEDSTYSVLSKNYGDTIIPEVYAEFGPALTKKFVKLFGGKQITVPNYNNFCDDMVGGALLALVQTKDDLRQLSEEYNMPYSTLARIYDRALKTRGLKDK